MKYKCTNTNIQIIQRVELLHTIYWDERDVCVEMLVTLRQVCATNILPHLVDRSARSKSDLGLITKEKKKKEEKKPENRRWSSRWPAQSIHKPKCKYISVPCGKARWATWTTATVLSYYGIFWSHWTPTMVLQQSDSHICLSGLFNPHNLTAQTHTNTLRIYVQIYLKMLKWSNCAPKQNQFHTMPTMWRA